MAAGCHESCEAEIEDLRLAACRDEQICWLDVTMYNTARMRRLKAFSDLNRPSEQELDRNGSIPDAILQHLTFEHFHRQERLALMLANFMESANIRVIDCRRGSRFTLETFQSDSVVRDFFGQKLQRYFTAETQILDAVFLDTWRRAKVDNDRPHVTRAAKSRLRR